MTPFQAQAVALSVSTLALSAAAFMGVQGKKPHMGVAALAGLGALYLAYESYKSASYAFAPARPAGSK